MKHNFRIAILAIALLAPSTMIVALVTRRQSSEPLNCKLVVPAPSTNNDGTVRTTYINLKQEGSRITGTIRVTQFFYHISESTGGPDGFTITGSMMDGKSERKVQYEGKLVGDELHVSTRRRPTDNPTQMVAVGAHVGDGELRSRNLLTRLDTGAD